MDGDHNLRHGPKLRVFPRRANREGHESVSGETAQKLSVISEWTRLAMHLLEPLCVIDRSPAEGMQWSYGQPLGNLKQGTMLVIGWHTKPFRTHSFL